MNVCCCYREVASAWECRVGPPDEPASADRVQSLFNDIELYPTKTQGKDHCINNTTTIPLLSKGIFSYRKCTRSITTLAQDQLAISYLLPNVNLPIAKFFASK